jgi:hypothetical protein
MKPVVIAILAAASLMPTSLPASAQSISCTTMRVNGTSYTDCTQTSSTPTPAPTPGKSFGDLLTAYANEQRAIVRRYGQEVETQRATALAHQQPGDTGMTMSVYGKPIHYD